MQPQQTQTASLPQTLHERVETAIKGLLDLIVGGSKSPMGPIVAMAVGQIWPKAMQTLRSMPEDELRQKITDLRDYLTVILDGNTDQHTN